MAVREVPKNEWTKDGKKWIFDVRYQGKRVKSKRFLTRREAQAAERDFFLEKEKIGNQSLMTLGDLFEEHLKYQQDKVKVTTIYNYSKKIPHFDSIKDIKLNKLTIHDIEKWKQEMNSKGLATKTKNGFMKYLKSALNFGSKWYDFNFSSLYNKMTNFSDPNERPKEMDFYTYEEFKKFISYEDNLKYKTLFETLYYCGLRRGEIRALTFKNVDLNRRELHIIYNCVNVSGDKGKWQITSTKTKSSNRVVPIPKVLLEDLKKLKEENQKYYGFNDSWFVFGDVTPIHPATMLARKKEIAEKAGLREIRIHDFRHSCASLLINSGANVTMVAKFLGHSKVDETLNTYSHMFKSKLDDIINIIDGLDD